LLTPELGNSNTPLDVSEEVPLKAAATFTRLKDVVQTWHWPAHITPHVTTQKTIMHTPTRTGCTFIISLNTAAAT